jgi:hypothetical protein
MGRVSALQKQLGITPVKPREPQAPAAPVAAPLVPTAVTVEITPVPPSPVPVYVSYGIGGAGLVIGAIFGGLALAQAKDINSVCKPSIPCPQEASAHDAALTKATVSDVGFGVAVAGAAVGTVLLLVNRTPATKAAVQSALGPGGLMLRF